VLSCGAGGPSLLSGLSLYSFKAPFAQDLDQFTGVAPRDIRAGRNCHDARPNFVLAALNCDFITGLNCVRGLCGLSIEQNKARVTKFLS
jgi:hypothetical protein